MQATSFFPRAGARRVALPRTQVRRIPQRQVEDVAARDAILDEGLVCHVGLVEGGQPFVMPTGYARDGDRLLLHGSRASRLMKALAAGAPVCITVTLLDGLVLSRSAFHHSMNYRSVVVFGTGRPLPDGEGSYKALHRFTDKLTPGRWDEIRLPNEKEMAGTLVVEVALTEWSVKSRSGPPGDEPEDMAHPAWSGVVPLKLVAAPPVQDPTQAKAPAPPHVAGWRPERRKV